MDKKQILALFLSISIIFGMALPVSAQGGFDESLVSENILEQTDEESGLLQEIEEDVANEEAALEQGEQELPETLEETETLEEVAETETSKEEVLVDSEAVVPQGSPLTYGVTGGVATARYKQVELSWEAVAEAESYSIYRGEDETSLAPIKAGHTTEKYIDDGVAVDSSYFYRIDSVLSDGTQEGEVFSTSSNTGLEALEETAPLHIAFSGAERQFDGTRTVDYTDSLDLVEGLDKGTIIIKAKFTGSAAQTSGVYRALFGFGNAANDKTKQIVMGANGSPFQTRYELGTGLYSTAAGNVVFSDNQWHVLALTAGDGYVSVSADGVSGTSSSDGYYAATKWNGFLTRGGEMTSLSIGGFSSPNAAKAPYGNWIGEIASITFTDEVLAPAVADQLTAALKADSIDMTLSNNMVDTPETVGSLVGNFTFSGGVGVEAALVAGELDNNKFSLVGNQLSTAMVLEPFSSYEILVETDNSAIEPTTYTIYTSGSGEGTLIEINERTTINGAINYPNVVSVAQTLEDITIKAQFAQTNSAIGSIFSVSDSVAPNNHFHVYANGGTVGYEIRGAFGTLSGTASALRSGGVNTIAFKADSSDYTYKLFVNGKLVHTQTMNSATYKMISDIAGLNAVTVGDTPRSGNAYPFSGELLHLDVSGSLAADSELLAYTAQTEGSSEDGGEVVNIFAGSGANFYRIPALYTLHDGTVMGAIDARFGGPADSPNNLDTTINFRDPETGEWGEAFMPFHFADYSDNPGYVGNSASFIDPVIVQDNQSVIYMMVDAFPAGYGYPNAKAGTGMTEVDGEKYLALTARGNNTGVWSNFDHYLKDGVVYDSANQPTEYTTDPHLNLYKNNVPLYIEQRHSNGSNSGVQVPMNIFYDYSDFKLFGTSYLYLASSSDGGQTWSDPVVLNNLKNSNERFFGTGPGRGHIITQGDYEGRILLPVYNSENGERTAVVYSDDGITWYRGNDTTMATSNSPGKSSEAQIVELPDGTLRMFSRGNTGLIGYSDSVDGGVNFSPVQQDAGLIYGGNVMITAINYSETIDGKPAIILASPEGGGRNNGIIRIGLIEENPAGSPEKYSIDWKYRFEVNKSGYVYSCLTELPNGDVALFYETNPNNEPGTYAEYTLTQLMSGQKSMVKSFGFISEPRQGEDFELELTVKEKIVAALSDLTTIQLELSFDNSALAPIIIEMDRISDSGNSIFFTGTMPDASNDYSYTIKIAETIDLFILTGKVVPTETDVLTGVVSKEVDRIALQQLVFTWSSVAEEDYTSESWEPFALALTRAEEILQELTATQGDVDQAEANLQTATENLVEVEPEKPDPEKPDPEKPDPEKPDPEKPDPEKPDPEKPDPEKPDPEKPDPEKPDPEKPDPEKPDPEKPDPEKPDPEKPDPEKPTTKPSGVQTGRGNSSSGGASTPDKATFPSSGTTVGENKPVNEEKAITSLKKALKQNSENITLQLSDGNIISKDLIGKLLSQAGDKASKVTLLCQSTGVGGSNGQIRVKLADIAASEKEVNLSLSTTNNIAQKIEKLFKSHFANELSVINLGQIGSFPSAVRVGIKLNNSITSTENLKFYSYNLEENRYTEMSNTAYIINNNGYVFFTASVGGAVVVSNGKLIKNS